MTSDLLELPAAPSFATKAATGKVLEFTVKRAHLDKALKRVYPVVPTKDLQPVLKNFHFQILESPRPGWAMLRIAGSDQVLSAVVRIPVQSTSPEGATAAFPTSRMMSLVRESSADTLHVSVQAKSGKQVATIKGDQAQWTLPLMDAEGFPDFSVAESVPTENIDLADFDRALSQVLKAASQDVMRPYLMLVDIAKGKMRASDSVRFQQTKFAFPFDCQIPVRAAHELSVRLRASDLSEIGVGQTENALLFRFGVVLLICQKSNAQFPAVDEVLLKPTLSNDLDLTVDRNALLDAVKRVRITADESTAAVVLSLNHGSVSVECKDRKGGFAVETVSAEWDHAPRHVSFNHQHLTDLLSSTKSETCVFRLGKDLKTKPTPLLMEDHEDGFTAVLSQIRLDWL